MGNTSIGLSASLGIEEPIFIFSNSFGYKAERNHPSKREYINFDFYLVFAGKSKFRGGNERAKGDFFANPARCRGAIYF